MIRNAKLDDASAIATIYNYYIENTAITFEETPVTSTGIQQRIDAVQSLHLPWLVVEEGSTVVGYAYATQWKARSAYRFTVEVTVYIASHAQGKGYGKALYAELFKLLKLTDVRSAIGVITLPNTESVALHEKVGMQKVAHFENVGFKFEEWLDVGYWQVQFF